jgi:phage terminase large subunit-like protein
MQSVHIIRGHLTGPRSVELDEAVADPQGEVQVIVPRSSNGASPLRESIHAFLKRLPAGTRTRQEIDQQLHEERDGWGERG